VCPRCSRLLKAVVARAEADGEEILDDIADRLAASVLLKVAIFGSLLLDVS